MPTPSLDALIAHWLRLREQGQTLAAADLCRDCPELQTEVETALSHLATRPDEPSLPTVAPPADSDSTAAPTATRSGEDLPTRAPAPKAVSVESGGMAGYEILGELGRGGMGVVYKARQRKANRVVALKMLLLDARADPVRFRLEAEAMARLQHPNIAQVYEVGEYQNAPYFTLEFCSGGSLEKKLNGTPLEPTAAAVLVEKLARAMHQAHAKGVLHRDLKPANVLLTEDGTPKVTDFGLAKVAADDSGRSALTQTGAVMGTPSYMPPEQATGASDIGPLADVYSLGAVLYDCLTGRPPFRAASVFDTLQQVIEQEPVPPRQLNPKVPRDLETICLKCLHKSPDRRYPSAEELADDLRRFLDDRPIVARPVSRTERVSRWCRRNPVVVALAALVVVAMASGTAASLHFGFRARASARQAETDAEAAVTSARIAEENEGKSKAFAKLAGRQRNLALESYRTLADEVQQKLRDTPEMQQLKQSLLRTAVEGLARLEQGEQDAALDADLTLAETYRALAGTLGTLGDRAAARKAYQSAFRVAARQSADSPDDPRPAVMRARVAVELARQFDPEEADALTHARSAHAEAEALAARSDAAREAAPLLVEARLTLGRCLLVKGEPKEAEERFAEALRGARALAEKQPNERDRQLAVGAARQALGTARARAADWKAAASHLREAVEISRRASEQAPEDEPALLALSTQLTLLGESLEQLRERDSAGKSYSEALALQVRLTDVKPFNVSYRLAAVVSKKKLGRLAFDLGELGLARERYFQAMAGLRMAYPNDRGNPNYLAHLADLHKEAGEISLRWGGKLAARNHFRESLRLVKSVADANPKLEAVHRVVLDLQGRVAEVNREMGQIQAARTAWADASKTVRHLKSLGAKDAAEQQAAIDKRLASLPKPDGRAIVNSIGLDLVRVPAGKYRRGCESPTAEVMEAFNRKILSEKQPSLFAVELPAHEVRISKAFYIGAGEVTRGQFAAFVNESGHRTDAEKDGKGFGNFNPSEQKTLAAHNDWRMPGRFDLTDDHPVAGVSWNDARAFCAWLSKKEGKTYRLPTEAEWEYACRAGSKTRFSNGDDPDGLLKVANVPDATFLVLWPGVGRSYETLEGRDGFADLAPVGSFAPNAWGLYDVHGNVWEWCSDGFDPRAYTEKAQTDPRGPDDRPARVMRGGCFM